jgi:acetyltransferase-like isoleucine patch superfamily enzyme
VQLGAGVRLDGIPVVSLAENSSIVIGDRVVLCSSSRSTALGVAKPVILRALSESAKIVIGEDVGMSGSVICAAVEIKIGSGCLLGADVTIVDTDFHPIRPAEGRRYAPPPERRSSHAVSIQNNVFIGTGATILKGVTVGQGSVIGAQSVVAHDVPEFSIVAGNPARVIGTTAGGTS